MADWSLYTSATTLCATIGLQVRARAKFLTIMCGHLVLTLFYVKMKPLEEGVIMMKEFVHGNERAYKGHYAKNYVLGKSAIRIAKPHSILPSIRDTFRCGEK